MTSPTAPSTSTTTSTTQSSSTSSSTSSSAPSSAFQASSYTHDGKTHILLAATGSVASIKLPLIIRGLCSHGNISIRIILTTAATHFFSGISAENPPLETLSRLPHVEGLYTDADEWTSPWQRGNPILHIELRRWADVMLVAPLDANTLAKVAGGIADNLLTSVLRAWDPSGILNPEVARGRRKDLLVAPAMNTAMWLHPATKRQIRVLTEEWRVRDGGWGEEREGLDGVVTRPWARVLVPKEKELACGDVGFGAMMEWQDIVKEVLNMVGEYD